jgi:hypothetical protein
LNPSKLEHEEQLELELIMVQSYEQLKHEHELHA